MRFLWALADLNPHMLRALNICNVEAPAASVAQPSLNAPRDWPVILVRCHLHTLAREIFVKAALLPPLTAFYWGSLVQAENAHLVKIL